MTTTKRHDRFNPKTGMSNIQHDSSQHTVYTDNVTLQQLTEITLVKLACHSHVLLQPKLSQLWPLLQV